MIADNVKKIIDQQQVKGYAKYGKSVDYANLTVGEWIRHAQEEAADMMIYLEKLKEEIRTSPKLSIREIQTDVLLDAIVRISGCVNQDNTNAYYNTGYVAGLYDAVNEVKNILNDLGGISYDSVTD